LSSIVYRTTYGGMNSAEAHNLGLQLHRHHRVAEAELYYRRAVELDPEFKEAWINLGLAVLAQQRPEEALVYEREALRLDPDHADAHNTLGMAHYARGHVAEAETVFEPHCGRTRIMRTPP
jgi:Flp pilus assembly protein TadD